jgi:hypothetical protein
MEAVLFTTNESATAMFGAAPSRFSEIFTEQKFRFERFSSA